MKKLLILPLFLVACSGGGTFDESVEPTVTVGDDGIVVEDEEVLVAMDSEKAFSCEESFVEMNLKGLNFCYDSAWGEPELLDVGRVEDTVKRLRFPESSVELWFDKAEFSSFIEAKNKGLQDGNGFGKICFTGECLDPEKPNEELVAELEGRLALHNGSVEVDTPLVLGRKVVRAHVVENNDLMEWYLDNYNYYISNVVTDWHAIASADSDELDVLEAFVASFSL